MKNLSVLQNCELYSFVDEVCISEMFSNCEEEKEQWLIVCLKNRLKNIYLRLGMFFFIQSNMLSSL